MSAESAFVDEMTPYAEQASKATGVNELLILAQWGNETAWGQHWAEANNIGNVGVYAGGPNQSFPTLQAGVNAYITEMLSPVMAKVRAAPTLQAQAIALGESGYAGGHYEDENNNGPGSALLDTINSSFGGGTVAGNSAPVAGGGNTGAGTTTESQSTADEQLTQTEQTNQLLEGQYSSDEATTPANEQSANTYIDGILSQYGLGGLSGWVTGELNGNKSADQVLLDLYQTPQFNAAFPGIALRQKNGLPAMSPADYLTYTDSALQMARAAGLPSGFMTTAEIGTLIGNDVSTNELSDRLTNGYQAAMQAPPETRTLLQSYYGITPGGMAAYFLDPDNAVGLLQQQVTAAQIGTAGVTSGVGDIGSGLAGQLAQLGVTQAQANSGFQNIGPLAPLETALPGTPTTGTVVTPDQLASSQFIGDAGSTRAVQQAQETRKAPSEGGGGYALDSKGVAGAGSAGQSGTSGQ